MSMREWVSRKTGALVSNLIFLVTLTHTTAIAQTVVVPARLCHDFSKRLEQMTAEKVVLLTTVPASGRVWSRCTVLLKDDIVAGQKCVSDVCAEVDEAGVVERMSGSIRDRLSACARTTIDLVRLSRSFDLLTISHSKVCPSDARPIPPR